MDRGRPPRHSSADRAALAFSLLPVRYADAVHGHLSIVERQRLKDSLARVRAESDHVRMQAFRDLSAAVQRGVMFPRPPGHDDHDCPFNALAAHPRARVAEVLERAAERDPLDAAVALCHFAADVRSEVWAEIDPATRAAVIRRLDDVHRVSPRRTRECAQALEARVNRSVRVGLRRGA